VADDDHGLAAAGDGRADVVGSRARGEPFVWLAVAEPEILCGLARAKERARQDRVGADALVAEPLAERACLLVPFRGKGAELVGRPRRRLGVADDVQAHGPSIDSLRGVPTLRYVVADVFTDTPLEGNQLAVFTDGRDVDDETMQALARETKFSETVFVLPTEADADVRIRIFTPAAEIPFAGHPTLGTAFVLGGPLQKAVIRLETGAGVVPVELEREGARIVFGRMQQPIPSVAPYEDADELLDALGVTESKLPIEVYDNGLRHVYVCLGSEEEVAALTPDFGRLARNGSAQTHSCFAGEGRRWKTRMFAPGGGVPEDPATGSAAGPLALHVARHGLAPFGEEIEITQGVEIDRPSKLYARVEGSAENVERVEVGGSAVIVARGEFRLP
jgi:trans-2,3-dihydro-3-hydroxyanthranilate isomerase